MLNGIEAFRDGATIRDRTPGGSATLSLPGKPTWISLTTTREATGRYNHVGFGIDFDGAKGDAERRAGEINAKYPESNAQPVVRRFPGRTRGRFTSTIPVASASRSFRKRMMAGCRPVPSAARFSAGNRVSGAATSWSGHQVVIWPVVR